MGKECFRDWRMAASPMLMNYFWLDKSSLYKLHFAEEFNEILAKFEIEYSICSRTFNYFIKLVVENGII